MKLLTITYSDLGLAWGPAVHYLELWNSVAVQDSSVEIEGWCCSWTGKPPLMPPRFQLHTLRLPPFLRARQLWADLNFAGRLLLAKRPTILYVRAASFQVALRAAMLARRFPVLVVEMNGLAVEDEVSAKSSRFILWAKSLSERALLKRCQLAICVSNQIAKSVSTRIGCPTVVIKNGVGRQFKPAGSELGTVRPQDQVTVIYVGTFTSWDGHTFIPVLARHFPQVRFVIIGDGQARAAIQQQAPENVVFRGWVPYAELPSQYQQADAAFVLYEFDRHRTVGLSSLKTLEYAASGLPIFSTRAKGQEFIEANGYGYLVAEEEDVTSAFKIFLAKLSEYKANLLRDQERIRYEGSWDRAANETLKALRPLLRSS